MSRLSDQTTVLPPSSSDQIVQMKRMPASQPARKPESQAATALQKDWMREEERERENVSAQKKKFTDSCKKEGRRKTRGRIALTDRRTGGRRSEWVQVNYSAANHTRYGDDRR